VSTGVKDDKVYLVGFMAAGKTTLARALARRLDWRAVDIDELVEQHERMPVAEIFARRGEPYFRTSERAALIGQLGVRHTVVATGGGTFADPQNRALINADGVAVWLDVPIERLIERLPTDGRRPLAADRAEFERLFQSRLVAYQQADMRLDAARFGAEELVDQLIERLERR